MNFWGVIFVNFAHRLSSLLIQKGISPYRLRKELDLSQTTITKWMEEERLPTGDNLIKLADYFNVSLDYLVGRTDIDTREVMSEQTEPKGIPLHEKYAIDEIDVLETFSKLPGMSKDLIRIMINYSAKMESVDYRRRRYEKTGRTFLPCAYTPVSAGIGKHMPHSEYTEMLEVPENDMTRYATYAFCVNGDSMEPDFRNNDVVAVKYTQQIDFGDIGIFDIDDTRYIKKYTERGFESLNPKYPVITHDETNRVCCLGAVLGKIEMCE